MFWVGQGVFPGIFQGWQCIADSSCEDHPKRQGITGGEASGKTSFSNSLGISLYGYATIFSQGRGSDQHVLREPRNTLKSCGHGMLDQARLPVRCPAMPISKGWFALALVLWALLPAPCLAQAAPMSLPQLETLLEEIVGEVAAERYDEAAQKISQLGDPFRSQDLRKSFQGFGMFGKSFYFDKVVERTYGNSGRDVIYKIAYPEHLLFVRFLIHKQRENWAVYTFAFQNENQAPLPRVWQHVYP
jgi:hypothetical protein